MLYLCLKFLRQMYLKWFSIINEKCKMATTPISNIEDLLKKLQDNHEDSQIFKDLSNHLLHKIHTENIEKTNEICQLVYGVEADVHNKDQSKIFCCLHQKMDPIVIKEIMESKFPGLRTRFFNWLEKKFNTKFITNIQNKIITDDKLRQLMNTAQAIIKIESIALDIFKDLFLATSILFIIGGPEAIMVFPTNFSSVVAMIAFATVILPLVLSTLQLMIVDPWAIFVFKSKRRISRPVMTFICFLLSGITPILLMNAFKALQGEAQKMAKRNHKALNNIFDKYRAAKGHFVEHVKIELGNLSFHCSPTFNTF